MKYYLQPTIPKQTFNLEESRFQAKNFLTSSNHYKYNRIREGGWGKHRPINGPNNQGQFDSKLIDQLQKQSQTLQLRNQNHITVIQKIPPYHQKLQVNNYNYTQNT